VRSLGCSDPLVVHSADYRPGFRLIFGRPGLLLFIINLIDEPE
jgi:hypothetical protein